MIMIHNRHDATTQQPCTNDVGEVAVNIIGNQTVQCIVASFEILTVQVLQFVNVVNCLRE